MKKITAIVLALLMVAAFAACSSKTDTYEATENKIDFEVEDTPEISSEKVSSEDKKEDDEQKEIFTYEAETVTFEFEPVEVETPEVNFDDFLVDKVEFEFNPIEVETPEINFEIEDFETDIKDNVDAEDAAVIGSISDAKKAEINTTKASLLEDLVAAFKQEGLNVSINAKSGTVSLDSSVLFGSDSSVLSDEGKQFLKKFINTYASVVYSEKYEDFISDILVEGHTAPVTGITYEESLPFSEERANVVKDYCLSADAGVNAEHLEELSDDLKAKGLSNSRPVTDADGNVDMSASRRVTFRFLIDMD